MSDEEEVITTVEHLCIGRRLTSTGKLVTFWRDADGNERGYPKSKGVTGSVYELHLIDRGNGRTAMIGDPEYVRRHEDESIIAAARAAELVDVTMDEQRKAERRAAQDTALDDLVAPLRALYNRQVGIGRKAAFVAVVTGMLTRYERQGGR